MLPQGFGVPAAVNLPPRLVPTASELLPDVELAPNVGRGLGRASRCSDRRAVGLFDGLCELHRSLVGDGAVWPECAVVDYAVTYLCLN